MHNSHTREPYVKIPPK